MTHETILPSRAHQLALDLRNIGNMTMQIVPTSPDSPMGSCSEASPIRREAAHVLPTIPWRTAFYRTVSWLARRIPLFYFKSIPGVIIIDVTNACNLRCPVCPVTFAMTRLRGLMPIERFRAIIDDLGRYGHTPAIYFNFSGEPTLNKILPDMIAYASARGHDTFVSTNATKMDEAMAEQLIRAGLGRINLCLDGFNKEAHEAYRVGSDFHEVRRRIEIFLAVRRRLGARKPVTVLQTLLTSYSEGDMEEIVAWAREIGFDQVRFKSFSLGSYTDGEQRAAYSRFLPTRPELRRHQNDRERATCTAPVHQSVVFWNGQLGLCCIDYDQMIELPNVDEHGFVAAFRSDRAARARRKGFAKQFDICKSCSYSNADTLGFKVNL
jgi:MoaA/NifB/PqqE/SkfB family radical SAM enzyme